MLLIEAVSNGRSKQVRLLLKAGVEVDKTDKEGKTALIHSCFLKDNKARMTILKLLVYRGANLTKQDKQGRNVFSWACLLGCQDVLDFLLENPRCVELEVNVTDRDGNSPLTLAVMSENLEVVKTVLQLMRDSFLAVWEFNQANNAGICPLVQAFIQGNKKCTGILIKKGGATISNIVKYMKRVHEFGDASGVGSVSVDGITFNFMNNVSVQTKLDKVNEDTVLDLLFTKRESMLALGTKNRGETMKQVVSRQVVNPTNRERRCVKSAKDNSTMSLMHNSACSSSTSSSPTDYVSTLPSCMSKNQAISKFNSPRRKTSSARHDFQQIMSLYSEQSAPSFRQGIPTCRYKTPLPPTPPRHKRLSLSSRSESSCKSFLTARRLSNFDIPRFDEYSESALDKQMGKKHARGVRSASLNVAALGNNSSESALDKRLRKKNARGTRSTSLHVSKLPSLFHTNFNDRKLSGLTEV